MTDYEILQIPTNEIKFSLRRARREAAYSRLKESIKEIGLKIPIGIRDISNAPAKERRRPGGGMYKFQLVYGQGRLQAFRELEYDRIPAIVVNVSVEEIVGRFLAENVMRRKLSWRDKAKLIEYDLETNGLTLEQVAEKYCITPSHARKYLRINKGASPKTLKRAEEADFDMVVTEKLTTLPKQDQDIVIDVMDEHQLDKSAIMHLVDEAEKLRHNGELTKGALGESLDELNADLRKSRELFKVKRLEYALGPQHLFRLVEEDEVFVSRAEDAGVDLTHFKQ